MKGKGDGMPPPGAMEIQIALRLGISPEAVEQMDSYWFSRLLTYFQAEADAEKIK